MITKRFGVFTVLSFIALVAFPGVFFAARTQAQPAPTAAPTQVARVEPPAADTSIYFAPQQEVDLQLPESLRSPAENTLLVGYDAAAAGKIDHFTTAFDLLSESSLATGQRLTLDSQGNLYSGYQDQTSLRVITSICIRENDPLLPAAVDYQITDPGGVVQPEGIEVIDSLAITLVADSNPDLPMIALFGKLATGETILGLRLTELGGNHPTDLIYDPAADRLFVATQEGIILIFNGYSSYYGVQGPDQLLIPFDPSGSQQVARAVHSIAYDPATDTLILADVGEKGEADDGQVLVLDNASQRSGNVAVRLQLTGAASRLRDPLDLAFDGSSLYVAEASNGALLRFDDLLAATGIVALPPDAETPAPDVRSVVLLPAAPPDASDCTLASPAAPTPTLAGGAELLTQAPTLQPPTDAPPAEPTSVPPTWEPPTSAPPTSVPPSAIPPTPVPPTAVPPTAVPPTPVPPTPVPPTPIPPTLVPPTDVPTAEPTAILPLPTIDLPLPLPTIDLPILDDDNSSPGGGGSGSSGPGGGHDDHDHGRPGGGND